jgi:hypothetical protein
VRISDRDLSLRQFERDGAIACAVLVAIALVLRRGRLDAAVGVAGGFALSALSYWAIKGAVTLVVGVAARAQEPGAARGGDSPAPAGRGVALAVKFFTRYALLAVGAYVMLACLRVHPVGLFAGATTPFLAAVVQATRASRAPSRRDHP